MLIRTFSMSLLLSFLFINALSADLIEDSYDSNGGITLRAVGTVDRISLCDALIEKGRDGRKRIKAVSLINQAHITDSSLRLLASSVLPNLTFLNVENTGVTREGMEDFARKYPWVKILSSFNPLNIRQH